MLITARDATVGSAFALTLVFSCGARAQPAAPPPPASPAPPASAQSAPLPSLPEPASTPDATPVSQGDATSWRARYMAAREKLLGGDFAGASAAFEALAREATDPTDRALAESLRDLAATWSQRGVTFGSARTNSAAGAPSPTHPERTIDELAQLYVTSIFYGIGTGGWIDAHTQPDTPGSGVLPMVLATGAAAGTVALIDAGNHPLRYGVPQAIVSGTYMGLEQGIALTLWNVSQTDDRSRWNGTTQADVIWSLSTTGAVLGGALGSWLGSTPGRASFVGTASLWTGLVTGLFVGSVVRGQADDTTVALAGAEFGLNAGLVAGLLAAGPISPSIARVRFLDIGALAGGLGLEGLYLVAAGRNPDARGASLTGAIGIATGLGIAWSATSRMAADRPEAARDDTITLEPTLTPVAGGMTLGLGGVI